MREFGWFLELNQLKSYSIRFNGSELDYSSLILGKPETIPILYTPSDTKFEIKYIQWNERINNEYSRYYYIDSRNNEVFKETTTLNNKGDHFYHSVYIKSTLFDDFNVTLDEASNQVTFGNSKRDDEFRYLKSEVDKILRKKRKPFLKAYTDKLISELENDNAFPQYNLSNPWDSTRKNELENIIRGLYQIEPKIFSNLNIEQKKTLLGLLDLVMDSDEKDRLFVILQQIVDLEVVDRSELADLLKTSRLSRIISTIKLIQDRYQAINDLKEILFNKTLNANERDHLQKMVEKHYWIFGEQYHLVSAAEPKFEQALKKWAYLLNEESNEITVDHPDKQGEMDIFAVRQDLLNNTIKNIVVELKSPSVNIGKKQHDQVEKYFEVILAQPECNAQNMFWEFYLVGNKFDTSGYIDRLYQNAKNHGEDFLTFKTDRYKIYVKKWSEIINDFELRHKFLNDKLEIERDKLIGQYENADLIIDNQEHNIAAQKSNISNTLT